jgi:hypothetical protein
VVVSVSHVQIARSLPRDFIGLSFEVADLPRVSRYAYGGNLVQMLRSLGPGVLRFGGVSADTETAWSARGARPAWAHSSVKRRHLAGLARLARASGWRVLLTLGFGHPDARLAASEAAAARSALGRSLIGFEIGNEPDAYVRKHLRAGDWSFAAYARQVYAYRRAVAAVAPGVPIVGPDASSGVKPLAWVRAEAHTLRPPLLTDHFYSSSSCGYTPVLSDLLDPSTRESERTMLQRLSAISRATRTPVRMDETNNISCGGQPGVSNVYVSALWAVSYIAEATRARISGLDFHNQLRLPASYTPVLAPTRAALRRGRLRAAPEWYALLLGAQLNGGRPVRVSVRGDARLVAAAVRRPDGRLQVILDNLGGASGRVVVHLNVGRRYSSGTILRLTGPSLSARSGVRLGGRPVTSDGRWRPPARLPRVSGRAGRLAVGLAPYSAALVTLG